MRIDNWEPDLREEEAQPRLSVASTAG